MTSPPSGTFITNHALVLSYISHNPRSTAREIANHIGLTPRSVHKIISDLDMAGYVARRKSGRGHIYRVDPRLPLRHHTKQNIMLSELLDMLTAWPGSPLV